MQTLPQIKIRKLSFIAILAIITISIALPTPLAFARSIKDIQDDITSQENELEAVEDNLADAEAALASARSGLDNSATELERLQAEIEAIEKEIELNEIKLDQIAREIEVKKLQRDEKEMTRDVNLENSYIDWRSKDVQVARFAGDPAELEKNREYESFLLDEQQDVIVGLLQDLNELDLLEAEFDEIAQGLEAQNIELQNKKEQLEAQILALQSAVNANSNTIGTLQNQAQNIESQISQLEQEQQAAFRREREILENDQGSGGGEIVEGEWFFYGSGRDLYQGHGVGMSQWGAYGMALNHGYTYQDIVNFYFTGVNLANIDDAQTVQVDGYGSMTMTDYIAGLAEVPSKACGTQAQVDSNPAKYVLDNPNTPWDCWPENAIKAQAVVARTYAVWYTSAYGSICTTTSCQVYTGGNAMRWAAEETAGTIITHNGSAIEAVYSSDNSQGYGTADNDTIWQNFWGDGTIYPYLRGVDDTGLGATTQWTNWAYETNGFTASDIDAFFSYIINQSTYSGSVKSNLQSVVNSIGNVQSLNFIRDNSLRVKKVEITGTTGQSRTIGGWWFKNMWNDWAFNTGERDYLYSQTFFLGQ